MQLSIEMKKEKAWILQKIQAQGIVDDTQYPAGTQVFFTASAPYIPVFKPNEKNDIALSFVRHEEAWWIVNHSNELSCAVNDRIIEPHHRMRLNDRDKVEWGLSSWQLIRAGDESHHDVPQPQINQLTESVVKYLDLDWFKQQQLNPQNPFDIIPVRENANTYSGQQANNSLYQLYLEYQQALHAPEQETPAQNTSLLLNEDLVMQDLTSLYNQKTYNNTLQDMVTGMPGIDAILDSLDVNDEGEMACLEAESLPDILHLLSPELIRKTAHSDTLPDLTQREHRIIGIDSHYRIPPARKNGERSHEQN